MVAELKMVCAEWHLMNKHKNDPVKLVDIMGAIWRQVEIVAAQDKLLLMGKKLVHEYADVLALVLPWLWL